MRKHEFVEQRVGRWTRLLRLLDATEERGTKSMADHELEELVRLYRMACSDLARARAEDVGDDVEAYLNDIVARGHKLFHPPRPPKARALLRFYGQTFPRAVRAIRLEVLAAMLLFVLPTIASVLFVLPSPKRAYLLAPPEQLEMLAQSYLEGHAGGRSEDLDSAMTGYYVRNNVGIAFRCFATGVFFGLGSIFFLIFNGVFGGAVGAYICLAGASTSFLSFVVGHGAFELSAIVLSGAAGLRMGTVMLNPGRATRLAALRGEADKLVTIVFGVASMLLIAAGIEGFWSPSGAPASIKFAVGGLLWFAVTFYLILCGRGSSPEAT
ncbi:MAG: stage II sporulation protein M [Myxococcota bacterium]|jgi:uncharacterized membrane protein SpoIIM required for sporulation|nr:stage II sporulation protein M [Myxococcota bacterium]